MARRAFVTCMALALAAASPLPSARAEDDKALAQEEFALGRQAFANGDFRRAGEAFEEAYRRKPHYAPLWNAARSWQRAGEFARAANLYARYLREAPADARERGAAADSLRELASRLGKIVVRGDDVTEARVDGSEVAPEGAFVAPGEHVVTGKVGASTARQAVMIAPSQELSVVLDASARPGPAASPSTAPPEPRREADRASASQDGVHLPWTVFAAGAALTAVGIGLTAWSGVDTLDQRHRFNGLVSTNAATQEDLDAGKAAQLRTNVLLGATALVAVLTVASAFFVEWRQQPR